MKIKTMYLVAYMLGMPTIPLDERQLEMDAEKEVNEKFPDLYRDEVLNNYPEIESYFGEFLKSTINATTPKEYIEGVFQIIHKAQLPLELDIRSKRYFETG